MGDSAAASGGIGEGKFAAVGEKNFQNPFAPPELAIDRREEGWRMKRATQKLYTCAPSTATLHDR